MITNSYFNSLEKKLGRLTFGKMLRAWRLADEQSQTAFAKRLKLSPQNFNDLEKGRKIPSAIRAAQIAKTLGLPVHGLIQLAIRDSLARDGFKYNVHLVKSA
jgi:transcriptional regulator with XRE-family HTH domain